MPFVRMTPTLQTGTYTVDVPRTPIVYQASARTLYVAENGNNSWSGQLSEPNAEQTNGPWKTFRYAAQQARQGDVVFFQNGVFAEGGAFDGPAVLCDWQGTAEQPIVFSCMPGQEGNVYITPHSDWYTRSTNWNNSIIQVQKGYVILYGLDVHGLLRLPGGPQPADFPNTNNQCCISWRSNGTLRYGAAVINCTCHDAQQAALKDYFGTFKQSLWEGNLLYDNGVASKDHGAYLASYGHCENIVRGNVSIKTPGYGFHIYTENADRDQTAYVYNNQSFEAGLDGFVTASQGSLFAHNVTANNRRGIKFHKTYATQNTVLNNVGSHAGSNAGADYSFVNIDAVPDATNSVDYNLVATTNGLVANTASGNGYTNGGHNTVLTPKTADVGFEQIDIPNHIYLCQLVSGSGLNSAGPVTMPGVTGTPPHKGIFDSTYYRPYGLEPVGRDLPLAYKVAQAVGQSLNVAYRVRQSVGRDVELAYAVRVKVGQDLALGWQITSAVGRDLPLRFKVTGKVGRDLSIAYHVRQAVGRDLTTQYKLLSTVGRQVELRWASAQGAPVTAIVTPKRLGRIAILRRRR